MGTSDSPLQMPSKRFTTDEKGHRANNQALETFGNIAFFGFVPVGGIIGYAGSSAPAGYLACNGAAINRHAYAGLFSIIGTTYGVGDGSTTFNIPTRLQASQVLANGTAGANGLLLIRTGVF
jgi:Microcystin-dependent protein